MAYDIVNGWKPGSKMMYLVLYQRTWKQRERPIINNIPEAINSTVFYFASVITAMPIRKRLDLR
jgi:uncharacterized protein YukJ